MKFLKTGFIVVLGSMIMFLGFDYFLSEKKVSYTPPQTDSTLVTEHINQVAKTNLIAMHTATPSVESTNFYERTFEPSATENEVPKLKRGKRFYNEERMEAVSTSANIEPIRD